MDFSKVDAEIEAGRLWRAKQILQGRFRRLEKYDAVLYTKYGELLLLMRDDLEAGKYLLLGETEFPSKSSAVALFLDLNKNSDITNIWGRMPKSAKLKIPDQNHNVLKSAFRSIGISDADIEDCLANRELRSARNDPHPKSVGDYLLIIIAAGIVVIGLRACVG